MSLDRPATDDEICVGNVMTHPVISLDVDASVHEALMLAKQRKIHHFPLTFAGRLAGFVCTCDLERASLNDSLRSCMHREVLTTAPETSTRAAAQIMNEKRVGSLLVTQGDRVLGIVTREDLSKDSSSGMTIEKTRCCCCQRHHRLRPTSDGRYVCEECARDRRHAAPSEHRFGGFDENGLGD
ncbi:MAG TPA: CBS domain-containing protein [Polyangiaceae bacterium]|nr:CBS domain-containing protein [Polyangiaceae bacterium]